MSDPLVGAHGAPPESNEEEVSRRTFMANATLTIGGIVDSCWRCPIVGSLIPRRTHPAGRGRR